MKHIGEISLVLAIFFSKPTKVPSGNGFTYKVLKSQQFQPNHKWFLIKKLANVVRYYKMFVCSTHLKLCIFTRLLSFFSTNNENSYSFAYKNKKKFNFQISLIINEKIN